MSQCHKGSEFEREICKKLSKWWMGDPERDDTFWRTSQSGGRATQRMKSGKTTYGSAGDVASVNPIGEPLIKFWTIELKRGSSHGCAGDLFDRSPTTTQQPFEGCLLQASGSAKQAGSVGWMLLCRRDHKKAVVYIDMKSIMLLSDWKQIVRCPSVRFNLLINRKGKPPVSMKFVGIPFDDFLERVAPQQIIDCLKNL